MPSFMPEEGYDATPLLVNGAPLYGGIILAWTACVLGVAGVVFLHRWDPALRHRIPLLTLLAAPSLVLIPVWMLYRPVYGGAMDCTFDGWMGTVVLVPLVLLHIARFAHAIHQDQVGWALLDGADRRATPSITVTHMVEGSADPPSGWSVGSSIGREPVHGDKEYKGEDVLLGAYDPLEVRGKWWFKHRTILSSHLLPLAALIVGLVVLILTGIATLLAGPYPPRATGLGQCMMDLPSWPMHIILEILMLLMYPTMLLMRGTEDAYGIRKELRVHAAVGGLAAMLYITTLRIPEMPQPLRTSLILLYAGILGVHGILTIYIMPLMDLRRILKLRERNKGMEAFVKLLRDEAFFTEFVHFSVLDYSVENALFYRRCRRLARLERSLHDNPHASTKRERKMGLTMEIEDIHERYLRFGAPFELDLSLGIKTRIREKLVQGECHAAVLDEAKRRVETLMFQHTYQRFLLSLSELPPTSSIAHSTGSGDTFA